MENSESEKVERADNILNEYSQPEQTPGAPKSKKGRKKANISEEERLNRIKEQKRNYYYKKKKEKLEATNSDIDDAPDKLKMLLFEYKEIQRAIRNSQNRLDELEILIEVERLKKK